MISNNNISSVDWFLPNVLNGLANYIFLLFACQKRSSGNNNFKYNGNPMKTTQTHYNQIKIQLRWKRKGLTQAPKIERKKWLTKVSINGRGAVGEIISRGSQFWDFSVRTKSSSMRTKKGLIIILLTRLRLHIRHTAATISALLYRRQYFALTYRRFLFGRLAFLLKRSLLMMAKWNFVWSLMLLQNSIREFYKKIKWSFCFIFIFETKKTHIFFRLDNIKYQQIPLFDWAVVITVVALVAVDRCVDLVYLCARKRHYNCQYVLSKRNVTTL